MTMVSLLRAAIDTSGLSPQVKQCANLLAEKITELLEDAIARMMADVEWATSS